MDSVIIYSNYPSPIINGSIINAFEYYIAIREYNKGMRLTFVNFSSEHKTLIFNMLKTRYSNLPSDYLEGIFFQKRSDILLMKFDRILVLDFSTMRDMRGLILAEEYYIISERFTQYNLPGDPVFFWDYPMKKMYYFNEMPFEYGDSPYKMKMLFDYYPKIKKVKEAILISSPDRSALSQNREKKEGLLSPDVLDEELKKRINRIDKNIFFKNPQHSENLFSSFSELYYVKLYESWDCHPRLMHEAFFYGKKIHYVNDVQMKDGSFYRYHDLQENGLKNRFFSKEDLVIQRFL